jgi:hypothetical protein
VTVDFLEFARDHKIALVLLPAHSSHLLQPLDVGLFGPLQHYYEIEVEDFTRAKGFTIQKKDFESMLQKARKYACKPNNIKSAWRATGHVPFMPGKVLRSKETPKVDEKETLAIGELPQNPAQLRQLQAEANDLVDRGDNPVRLKYILGALSSAVLIAQGEAGIQNHHNEFLQLALDTKRELVQSQARLQASPMKRGRFWSEDEIDGAVARNHEKKAGKVAKEAEKVAKKKQKEDGSCDKPIISTLSEEFLIDSSSGM